MTAVDELITFLQRQLDAREEELAEDERVAQEASRGGTDGSTPSGEHWQWVEPNSDQVITLDPMLDEYLHYAGRAHLRSIEEYPSATVGLLPHFVVHAEEQLTVDAMHIARFDPARVLEEVRLGRAEVAAKRALLELHSPHDDDPGGPAYCNECQRYDGTGRLCDTAYVLAQPYAGRPGWREEWDTPSNES